MGSYSSLRINGFEIYFTKCEYDPYVMTLFQEKDKLLVPFDPLKYDLEPDEYDTEDFPEYSVEYVSKLAVIKDRLDLLGITMQQVGPAFYDGIEAHLEHLNNMLTRPWLEAVEKGEQIREDIIAEINLLSNLTYEKWLEAFERMINIGIKTALKENSAIMQYMLGKDMRESGYFGFHTHDIRLLLRLIAELKDTNAMVVYDMTDIVAAGYFDAEQDFVTDAHRVIADNYLSNQSIIILTEGHSDKWAIERSMRILYPHIFDYFSFMDFEGTNAPGGATALVATVKAFIGAGIANRIIALFDNDTASKSALRNLKIKIPDNFRILQYPNLPIASQYPTIGPSGITDLDVNGMAVSVEHFFGIDILRQADGTLTPVQWQGYDNALGQYQGELLNKDILQKRFNKKLRQCEENPEQIEKFDWSGMRSIIDILRNAFNM